MLIGYASELSVAPGGEIAFMVSAEAPEIALRIVRWGVSRWEPVAAAIDGAYPGGVQVTRSGSLVRVPIDALPPALALSAWVRPTLLDGRPQGIMGFEAGAAGFELHIGADGVLELELRDGARVARVRGAEPLRVGRWHRVGAGIDPAGGTLIVRCEPLGAPVAAVVGSTDGVELPGGAGVLCIGACGLAGAPAAAAARGLFDGCVEAPSVIAGGAGAPASWELPGGEPFAAWQLGEVGPGAAVRDAGPRGLHGITVNAPTMRVPGHAWSGRALDPRLAPGEHTAMHLHRDDLADAAWPATATWRVPQDLPSGLYGAELRAGDACDTVPFVVVPSERERHRTLVLLPTMTYVAYANERCLTNEARSWRMPLPPSAGDLLLERHPEWGRSLYDVHADGSGVACSSSLRPIPNLRTDYAWRSMHGPRHLSTDALLLSWLTQRGSAFGVVTDHDLHREGDALLRDCDVLITGSHPEYTSERMLDAFEHHLDRGGRMLYLGGNGFYWVTTLAEPATIEVRRGSAGTRTWTSAPGEAHHGQTGEPGGLWRERGRAPNRLVGIGFAGLGLDVRGRPFRRERSAAAERFAWVFEGLEEDAPIGDFGLAMGAAGGDELDAVDPRVAVGGEVVVLASARDFGPRYVVPIETLIQLPIDGGEELCDVRADIAMFTRDRGGQVFAAGSVSWCASLPENGWRNSVATVTGNVLDAFLREPPVAAHAVM